MTALESLNLALGTTINIFARYDEDPDHCVGNKTRGRIQRCARKLSEKNRGQALRVLNDFAELDLENSAEACVQCAERLVQYCLCASHRDPILEVIQKWREEMAPRVEDSETESAVEVTRPAYEPLEDEDEQNSYAGMHTPLEESDEELFVAQKGPEKENEKEEERKTRDSNRTLSTPSPSLSRSSMATLQGDPPRTPARDTSTRPRTARIPPPTPARLAPTAPMRTRAPIASSRRAQNAVEAPAAVSYSSPTSDATKGDKKVKLRRLQNIVNDLEIALDKAKRELEEEERALEEEERVLEEEERRPSASRVGVVRAWYGWRLYLLFGVLSMVFAISCFVSAYLGGLELVLGLWFMVLVLVWCCG
ncbi:hypothetical protein MMC10_010973 [Thelotrema lepadinum]|nr:hypothetical protein [Thelotrema lepadinum]